jgi:O-antigen/teichoic acid export membrane protein
VNAPRRHLGAGAALSVFVQGGPLLAGGVLSIVLARTIGPSGNGHFALLVTLTGVIAMVVSLGLAAAITYEVSRRRWSVKRAFGRSYAAAALLGFVGILGGLGIFGLAHKTVFGGISTELALVALASLPPVLAYQFADAIMLARERYESYAGLEISHSLTLLIVGATLALGFGLAGAVIGLPAAAVVGALVGAWLLVRETRRDTGAEGTESLRPALRFGLQSWAGNLLQQINYRFDVLILGGFASARAVGVYSIALTLTSIAWVLPQALQTVLFPRTASLAASTLAREVSPEEADEAVARAIRHGVLLTIPTALFVIGLLTIAVPVLYGRRFHETIVLGFIMLPGVLFLGVAKILAAAIAGRGKPRYTLYSSLISVPLTLGLYFALIPMAGARGAALGSCISYLLTSALTYVFFRRVADVGPRRAFVPGRSDFADYRFAAALARQRFGR